ncbi:hypothetical protein CXB51_035312 [Gossypium anomalum]|uniref:Nuclease associated modular domain-containing protein n=1 Tax=Gossypium anomalum TaxID=47600 RepID=A0A8J6CH31_9ROSI|nr:hypothetical protein CXB51_035312 [Gossypium anomalum]
MHRQPNMLLSNYHQIFVKKVFSSYSRRCSLSLQPVRALQSSMGAEEGFMFCNSCWSEDSIKSKQMQNLSEEAHVYDCYSSREFSNDEDFKEEQRRRKIGLANKGRVPWNKGWKHSAETRLRIKQRTIEALNDPKVRKKMAEHPRTHSEESKARIGSSVKRAWGKRLKWKRGLQRRPREKIAKVRAEKARAERIARIVQKRKEQEEKEKARELKRTLKEKATQDESLADSQGMKLKQRLQMVRNLRKIARECIKLPEYVLCSHGCHSIELETSSLRRACIRKKKSISNQVNFKGDTSHIPALEKLNIELIKKQKMQSEVSLAEQIKAAKSRRAEPISAKILAVSSSFVSYNSRLKEGSDSNP